MKRELHALMLASRDPRTPRLAKVVVVAVAAYALSPIDLIPDFVPVLGYLDDLLIVPLGLWLGRKLVPAAVLRDARILAAGRPAGDSLGRWGAIAIALAWFSAAVALTLAGWLRFA